MEKRTDVQNIDMMNLADLPQLFVPLVPRGRE